MKEWRDFKTGRKVERFERRPGALPKLVLGDEFEVSEDERAFIGAAQSLGFCTWAHVSKLARIAGLDETRVDALADGLARRKVLERSGAVPGYVRLLAMFLKSNGEENET